MGTHYMEILERLKTRHLLTSSAVASLARILALLEKAQALREAGRDYGGKCYGSLQTSDPIISLSKIALYLENGDLNTSYMDFPKSGMMHNGSVYKVASLDCNNVGKGYIYIYIIAYPGSKFSERKPPKPIFRQPYLPGELSRVYPGWRERRDLPEPRTFRSVNDIPNLVDRNKCLGNAVQPLMAQYLFECIKVFDAENV